jgi:hypothetical protein
MWNTSNDFEGNRLKPFGLKRPAGSNGLGLNRSDEKEIVRIHWEYVRLKPFGLKRPAGSNGLGLNRSDEKEIVRIHWEYVRLKPFGLKRPAGSNGLGLNRSDEKEIVRIHWLFFQRCKKVIQFVVIIIIIRVHFYVLLGHRLR